MDFDVLIVGGGAAGMSCALILGSAQKKSYAKNRKVGIILHQKTSDLQNALFNNVLGLPAGTKGIALLKDGPKQLKKLYPKVVQIENEKVLKISPNSFGYTVETNKDKVYRAKKVVIAAGYSDFLQIKGLETYIISHKKSEADKKRIQLKNEDHLVAPNLHVAGNLAGHRSQFAIACGSGAAVATDILTEWNNGMQTKVHDKLK